MPVFLYRDRDGKIHEIVQRMNEIHEAYSPEGFKMERVFVSPNAAVDTQINPNSAKEFVAKTAKNGMTLGEMQDLSAELSEKRGGITGQDEVRQKAEDSYSAKTKGKRHPHSKKKQETIYI